ncbi:MAG: YdeI/OmpD-associated family protein, partial [Flavobacteriales bacterium]|nr:YdeI/OmpD-associated family protein [Flavobacteriales bacterium]
QATIDRAKQDGTWEALISVQAFVVPDDLQRALSRNKAALKNFNAFPPSSKRIILEWILNAKRPETRAKRIQETVEKAARNVRANHFRR